MASFAVWSKVPGHAEDVLGHIRLVARQNADATADILDVSCRIR